MSTIFLLKVLGVFKFFFAVLEPLLINFYKGIFLEAFLRSGRLLH